jgi:hypothetical protein
LDREVSNRGVLILGANISTIVKVKQSRYRPGVAQRVTGIYGSQIT